MNEDNNAREYASVIMDLPCREPEPFEIEVKYHEGASKLESHGVMMDMAASETVELKQGEAKVIPLGVSMKLPEGFFGFVVPRSSTCLKHGIMMANSVGIIEPDYCGNNDVWGFVAYAIRDTTIEKGTRIAQFMPVSCFDWGNVSFKELDTMPYPNRGGYGSTGTKASEPQCLDADGVPIKVGDVVYYCERPGCDPDFPPNEVEAVSGDCFFAKETGHVSHYGQCFTHRKPDSWEQLIEDVVAVNPQDYVTYVLGKDADSTLWSEDRKEMRADVLRRVKRLAGVCDD